MLRTKTAKSRNCEKERFSVETLFFFLPRALSISLYTLEKLRDRGSLLHYFKVEYECVGQSKWKLKFCNYVLIDCRDRELKWHEQVSRSSALKVGAKAQVIEPGLIEDEV